MYCFTRKTLSRRQSGHNTPFTRKTNRFTSKTICLSVNQKFYNILMYCFTRKVNGFTRKVNCFTRKDKCFTYKTLDK